MTHKTHKLHSARLKNNCPTCFGSNGLEFTFTQKEKDDAFFTKPSKQIEGSLYCHNCETQIYPVNWNEDIERVYDYNKNSGNPEAISQGKTTILCRNPIAS